jgi:hypothetical protein
MDLMEVRMFGFSIIPLIIGITVVVGLIVYFMIAR